MKIAKASLGKLVFWILLIIFSWLVITRFAQTRHIFEVLVSGKWYWILLAVGCQVFFYPFYANFLQKVFQIFRAEIPRGKILPMYLATKFTDVALPIASVGQIGIFVRNGKKHNISPLNAGISVAFVLFLQISAFLATALLSLIILYVFHEPRTYLVFSILILALVIALATLFLVRLSVYRIPPDKFVLWIITHLARMFGQKQVDLAEIEKIFLEIGADLKKGQDKILPVFWMAFTTHLLNMMTFAFIYLAFAGSFNPLAIIAGYVACLLFTIVSVTPQGVGVAETILVATLHSFGMDISVAAVITLAFRGLLYWLPFFPGFYFFSKLELRSAS